MSSDHWTDGTDPVLECGRGLDEGSLKVLIEGASRAIETLCAALAAARRLREETILGKMAERRRREISVQVEARLQETDQAAERLESFRQTISRVRKDLARRRSIREAG
jgi:hypothetical protein